MTSFYKFALTLIFGLAISFSYAQDVPISQGGTVTATCGDPAIIFTDSNADGGNYAAGEDFTITFCPDGGNAVSIVMNANNGPDSWDVASGDLLQIYDGPDATAPLLATYGSEVPLDFFNEGASLDNASGCLTVVFTSGDSSPGAAGWTASVACGNYWQPFEIELTTSPVDLDENQNIDVCQGETLTFTGNGNFPFSTGSGYNQTNENSYWEWDFGNGIEVEGLGLNNPGPITYTDQAGFPIVLFVTDTLGIVNIFEAVVRVSTTPSFAGTISEYADSICLGNTATLIGGVPVEGFGSVGVNAVPTSVIGGGFLAGQTFLPDDANGTYSTVINIDDFATDQVINEASDIVSVCLNMEHTYLGDLTIQLTCPDGTSTMDIITFGNNSGGGTFLGEAVDNNQVAPPGVGYDYCWAPGQTNGNIDDAPNNTINYIDNDGANVTANVVPAGTYEAEGSFDEFIGCPANGDWTITVFDNLASDNGYIFSWGIQFNPVTVIDLSAQPYAPEILTADWDGPHIIFEDDSSIVVQPPMIGMYDYSLSVTDDFGCSYDTLVGLTVVEPVTSMVASPACFNTEDLVVNDSYNGGIWGFTEGPEDGTPFFNTNDSVVSVTVSGDYTLTYTDLLCEWTQEHNVFFVPLPTAEIPEELDICAEEPVLVTAEPQHPLLLNPVFEWTLDGDFQGSEESQEVQEPGEYRYRVYDPVCDFWSLPATLDLTTRPCVIETFNVFTPNGDGQNDTFSIQSIQEEIYNGSELMIYNRWGNIVHEAVNYKNDWDMEDIEDGTYFFVLNVSNGDKHTGSFTVIR